MKRFTLGSSSIGELEKKYVMEVLDNNFISPGPVVEWVEKEGARRHGKKHGLAIHSGQSAIHVGIQAIVETKLGDLGRKPVVAVPACTYISTLAAPVLVGCEIVMVDVEVPSCNMSAPALRKVLEERDDVDIVVPVHLYGKACSPEIFEICEQYGLWVVEDGCESSFAPHIGKGHILTTSFFSNHLISGGGGGLIMTDEDDLDLYCWKLINHGRNARFSNDDIHRISDKFRFDIWAHSMKWSDVPAAIVKAQMERADELFDARARNAETIEKILAPLATQGMVMLPDREERLFMMYTILINPNLDVMNIIKHLNDNQVEVRRLMPITNQPVVEKHFPYLEMEKEFPNADLINRQGLYVGCHPELDEVDMKAIGNIVRTAVELEMQRVGLEKFEL